MADRTKKRFAAVVTDGETERRIVFKAHTLMDAVLGMDRRTKTGEVTVAIGEEEYIQ